MTAKDTKSLRGHGHINISNVDSQKSECVTMTYSVMNVKTIAQASTLKKAMDKKHSEDSVVILEITDLDGKEQAIKMKYKVKACGDEAKARAIKSKLDKFLQKQGGQTTLTEEFDDEEDSETKS